LPLLKRKEKLREILTEFGTRILYLQGLDGTGVHLFRAVYDMDIEG
jgi:hypothetical protein